LKNGPEEIPDADHELVIERVCAIDVAKASGKVCMRLPWPGRRISRVWDVDATTAAVCELADHLVAEQIERVTVESTSDYWRIWYYLLEAAGRDVQLVNARDVKNVPGRPKSDKLDSVWLAKLTEKGLLRPSFVPPAPIRQLRDYTRLRVDFDPGTFPLLAAPGETARRRADQGVIGGVDSGHPVGAGHARSVDRR
jgi:hypothetical protein